MEENVQAEKLKRNDGNPPRGVRGRKNKNAKRYPFELKLKAVKLYLEEGFTNAEITQQLQLGPSTLAVWVRDYRASGEAGLKDRRPGPPDGSAKLPPAVTEKIIALKKENPAFGIKRISQWLRRTLFLQASAETVRRKLHQAELIKPKRPRPPRNVTRPRFFERATPNQMWQSDIFTFRLGGRYAYLIAFLDDYSRFIVGADLFRSPTAEAVIEVYRRAVAEFKPPREMLTDNGRQYTSWRGTSRFEAELKKDGVAHFKSRPQHPMTLGKIERFWATIWQDFLTRAQFESFDSARERIRFWIQHYNHKRPHQGIDGLCPADRFFEIQNELRKTIEAGIKENLLEMALRGEPRAPFYMVGRMEGQSVVLRAEKGKLKLELSDEKQTKELTYDLQKGDSDEQGNQSGKQNNPQTQTPAQPQLLGAGKSAGDPGGVDRAMPPGGSLPADADQLHDLPALATASDGRNAAGAGEPGEPEQGGSAQPAAPGFAPETTAHPEPGQNYRAAGPDPACQNSARPGTNLVDDRCQRPSGHYPAGPLGPVDRDSSCPATGHLPPALLRTGANRAPGNDPGAGTENSGTPPGAQTQSGPDPTGTPCNAS